MGRLNKIIIYQCGDMMPTGFVFSFLPQKSYFEGYDAYCMGSANKCLECIDFDTQNLARLCLGLCGSRAVRAVYLYSFSVSIFFTILKTSTVLLAMAGVPLPCCAAASSIQIRYYLVYLAVA